MPMDPVCCQMIDIHQAAACCEYKGRMYYFCSSGCHKTFTADLHRMSGATPEPLPPWLKAELRQIPQIHP
jgi:YHS domain-containing protein